MPAFRTIFAKLKQNKAGNFGMLTAFMLVPLMGMVGLGLDLVRAAEAKIRIQGIADAAILAAINPSSLAQKQRGMVAYNYTDPSWAQGALSDFNGQIKLLNPLIAVESDMVVKKTGNTLESNLTFTAEIPTTFLQLLSIKHVAMSGTASAVFNGSIYKDFYVLVDNSPSMGLGATTTDIALMNRRLGCAFACHTTNGQYSLDTQAAAIGAKLRIDVVREGLGKFTDAVKATQQTVNTYRLALYNLGTTAEIAVANKIEELSPLTSDMAGFTAAASKLKLMPMPWNTFNNNAMTDMKSALNTLNKQIQAPGDGTSVSQAGKYVIFITDGVQNSWPATECSGIWNGRQCMEYIHEAYCSAIKSRGIKIAILYTTYLPRSDGSYNSFVRPYDTKIAPALRSCASSGLFFEVNPTQGIPEAMETLFATLTAAPVITQ